MPLDPLLPDAVTERVLQWCRPAAIVSEAGTERLSDPLPVSAGAACVLLTGGSTGHPKPVELSFAALESHAAMVHARLGAEPGDGWECRLPLHHVAGFSQLVRARALGTDLVFPGDPLPGAGATFTSLVPAQLRRALDSSEDLDRFACILVGGDAVPARLLAEARAAGVSVMRTYGMTETCGGVVYDGVPLAGVEVRIGPGAAIEISTPTLMTRYLGPGASAESVLGDGWYRTGDLGRIEDGRLFVQGRADDVIVTGGYKVSASEVRRALLTIEGVVDAVVVGVADDRWGSRVVAAVEGNVAPRSVPSALRGRVHPYAIPKDVLVVATLPRMASGKPDLPAIREMFG